MADEQTRVEAGRILQRFDEEVDGRIQSLLQQTDPTMANVASYFFGWVDESFNPIEGRQGKKLRSTLNLLVHEAVSGSFEPALPVAASVEFIHNYSLIHDDIEDRDVERRGRPTLWRIWGDGIALNVGNVLHALAFQSLHDLSGGLEPRFLEIREAIATTSLRLCQGQHWDLSFEKAVDVTQEMYLEMIAGKTAALIECSTYTGAVLATNGERLISAYRNFGNNLGFAFQIRDDFLNIWGDNAKVGKSQYSDLLRKKKTLPVVYALNALTGRRRERLAELYADVEQEMSQAQIEYVLELLEEAGAREHTSQMVEDHIERALAWLDWSSIESEAQNQLRVLARFLASREY